MTVPTLTSIHCYPIKSCGGIELPRAELDRYGLALDRAFMLVDPEGRCVTQREAPRLALVTPSLAEASIALRTAEGDEAWLPLDAAGETREVRVWRHVGPALDQGDELAAFFSDWVSRPLRLVRIPPDHQRRVNPERHPAEAHTAFSDGYPLLLLSEASLEHLNRRLETPVEMRRFRPNLVVSGCAPHAEDGWTRLRIGEVAFAGVKDCPRCVMTTVDPERGERSGSEPLRTLARYRRRGDEVLFGRNLVHRSGGAVAVGDSVAVLEENAPEPAPT